MKEPARPDPLEGSWWTLPVALLLLVTAAMFTLFSYRSGVVALIEDRRAEALAVAESAAATLPRGPIGPAQLRRLAPRALAIVRVTRDGRVAVRSGDPDVPPPLEPWAGEPPREGAVAGPGDGLGPRVAALVPLDDGGWLRVDLPAARLMGQRRSVAVLTWVVAGATGGIFFWLLLFLRRLLGPYREVLSRARELRSAAGEDEGVAEASLLLRTFERALEAAREGAELEVLERTLGGSPTTGLLLLDGDGRVLAMNPAAGALVGASSHRPHAPLEEALAGQPELAESVRAGVAAGEGFAWREMPLARDGGELAVGVSSTPLSSREGAPLGFLVLLSDATEARRARREVELAESLAHLGELAAGVAHELRNGLATVAGYHDLLARAADDATRSEYLDELERETEHLQRVVGDFLAFARPQTARPERVELDRLVARAVDDPKLAGVRLQAGNGPACFLRGDPHLLERALRNLLLNAVEAAGEEAAEPVVVRCGALADGGWEVAICDRGPGLPPAVRARLFVPFSSGRPGGVGMGLALAHRIVSLHHGTVRLEEREGGGTCARVRFPPEAMLPPA